MRKPLRAVAGAVVVALVLTACSAAAHRESRAWAAGCARAEADVWDAALEFSPFVDVTTPHDVIVAAKKVYALGPEIVAARKAMVRTTFTGPAKSIKVVSFPPPLARQMHQVDADLTAFGAASVGYRYHKRPQAIADVAQKLMHDIRAVRATCSQKQLNS
jgi:hypothetical protein